MTDLKLQEGNSMNMIGKLQDKNHTAAYKKVPDTLAAEGSMKTVAEYGSVQISNPSEANWPKNEKSGNI